MKKLAPWREFFYNRAMGKKKNKHAVNIRGIIPLFFRRYYFVILIGRDTREATRAMEADRRAMVERVNNAIAAAFLLTFLGIFVFLLLYWIKSALGINIFPDRHLSDFVNVLLDPVERWFDRIGGN